MLRLIKRAFKKWVSLFSYRALWIIVTISLSVYLIESLFDRNFSKSDLNAFDQEIEINDLPNNDPLIGYTSYTVRRLGTKPLHSYSSLGLESTIHEPVINDVLAFQYPIDIDPREKLKCTHWADRSSTSNSVTNSALNVNRTLLIIVISGAGHWAKRDLIRKTWARPSRLEADWIQVIFLIGSTQKEDKELEEKLRIEKEEHGDLVQVNVVDTYENLTLKSVALLHWTYSHCPHVDFVLKCDDDNYINLNILTDSLWLMNETKSIYGTAVPTLFPERYKNQKHFISRYVWPWNRYPAYLMGGCYAIGGQAVKLLLAAIQITPYFTFEDVYITGLCASKANVTLRTEPQYYRPDIPEAEDLNPCLVKRTAIWQTRCSKQFAQSHSLTEEVYHHNLTCTVKHKTKFKCNRFFGLLCW